MYISTRFILFLFLLLFCCFSRLFGLRLRLDDEKQNKTKQTKNSTHTKQTTLIHCGVKIITTTKKRHI